MASLEELWNQLQAAAKGNLLLKKHLTVDICNGLKDVKTKFGGTLADCIKSGCENPVSGTGIYASDPEAYDAFADILHPAIKDYHKISELKHPQPDFGDINNLGFDDLDPSGKYIVSTGISVRRSHAGYGFPPVCKDEDRVEMEKISVHALNSLCGELNGTYHSLIGMRPEKRIQLTERHMMFLDDDRHLRDAGGYNGWPHNRGIFHTDDMTLFCWINEEDHLRLFSTQEGGDLGAVYKLLVTAIKEIEKKLTFVHHKDLGYLTFSPTNLGTTLNASVRIKIPKLATKPEFYEVCEKLSLQPREIDHSKGEYDVSYKKRMGLTEIQVLQEMRFGVEDLLKMEKNL